jgi:pimeloyl-ACP methyl ester carboxylesterase
MQFARLARLTLLGVMACALLLPLSGSGSRAVAQSGANAAPQVRIYMMRGLLGVFSLGIDTLAERLRAQGYDPRIYAWDQWGSIASDILARNRAGETGQIILIGHSLGSDSTIQVASAVRQANIPIDLIVTFDITQPLRVPSNVQRFINYYQDNGFGKVAQPGYGFTGELVNVDLTADHTVTHTNIDKNPRLQELVVEKVFDVAFQQTKKTPARQRKRQAGS